MFIPLLTRHTGGWLVCDVENLSSAGRLEASNDGNQGNTKLKIMK
jgi:hypothetical protein